MALNTTGPISFGGSTAGQSINLELGVSATAEASINSAAFRTLAGVASGAISLNNFYGKSNAITGQIAFTSPGTYTWVVPTGVSSISAVAIGGGSYGVYQSSNGSPGGAGGGLSYNNNYAVTPGDSWTVVVPSNSNTARLYSGGTKIVEATGGALGNSPGTGTAGGSSVSRTGGNGGYSTSYYPGAGGGAAGYSGNGGQGGYGNGAVPGSSGSGGGGAGGGNTTVYYNGSGKDYKPLGFGGGGTGILGEGASGTFSSGSPGAGGSGGGTGGTPSYDNPTGGYGGAYGGGAGSPYPSGSGYSTGGSGAVRIIYPGSSRSFPSTNTGNL